MAGTFSNYGTNDVITRPFASGVTIADKHKFVTLNSSGQYALVAAQGVDSYGVMVTHDNKADAGVMGTSGRIVQVIAGEAIAIGDDITTGADAKAETAATGDVILGKALTAAAADNDLISIFYKGYSGTAA